MRLAYAVFKRFAQALLTALGASVLVWALLPLAPGDPALRLLQAQGIEDPNERQIEVMREYLALDRPLPEQYLQWLGRVLQGDLSLSYRTRKPVLEEIGKRLPATLLLAGVALALALILGVSGGALAALYRNRWPDHVLRFLNQIGASMPSFLIGLLILYVVVIQFKIGRVLTEGSPNLVWLPAICLIFGQASSWAQLVRNSLLEALGSNYVLVARARGAKRFRLLWRYALPNALIPFLTSIGVGIGGIIGGAAIIESVFTWPGVGSLVLQAISARDFPIVQGFVLLSSLSYVMASLLVDVIAILIDPRLRA